MEPAEAEVRIVHVVYTLVEAIRPSDMAGWWVHFVGSRESIHFDGEQPFKVNDQVKITFEKVTNNA